MKKKILVILALVLVTIPLAGCRKEVEVTSDYDQGLEYLEERKYSNAIDSFEKALNETPNAPQIYLKIAEIYDRKGLTDKAIDTLDIGIENADDDKELLFQKAEIQFKSQDFENAVQNYQKAIKKGYGSDVAVIKKGITSIKLEEFGNARKEFKNIEKNSDYYSDANFYLSVLETEDYEKSLEYIKNVKSPQNEEIKDKATTYQALLEEVIEEQKKEGANPNYVKLLHGYALIKAEQFEIAKTIISPVAKYYQEEGKPSYQASFYLGSIHYHLKEYEDAKSELMTSIVANPTDPITLHLLGLTYSKLNDQVKSGEYFEKSITLDPNSERSRYDFVKSLIKFKINSKAEQHFEELIKLETEKKPQYQLEFAQFLNNVQNNASKANNITSYLVNEWEEFETASKETRAEIYDTHGWSYYLMDQNEKAQGFLVKSIEEDQFLASAYYHLAKVMEKNENYEKATEYYARAIDLSFEEELSQKANQEYERLTQ